MGIINTDPGDVDADEAADLRPLHDQNGNVIGTIKTLRSSLDDSDDSEISHGATPGVPQVVPDDQTQKGPQSDNHEIILHALGREPERKYTTMKPEPDADTDDGTAASIERRAFRSIGADY